MERKYRPSNGSEGDWFVDKYCMNCLNCDPNPEGKKQCEILMRSMCFGVNDPQYPEEWINDDNDNPKCTAWIKWDWGNNGDPDDPDNPNYRPPDDPNQLCFPFIFDEIGVPKTENEIA